MMLKEELSFLSKKKKISIYLLCCNKQCIYLKVLQQVLLLLLLTLTIMMNVKLW